ncbi:hypothetical protein AWC38_SpisGene24314 [Stylophora pistillata]|uniref:Uncharacterized protein n=1 Tax=Stylophora pistillata TaxID=50429 RepID=A0A2B4R5Q7_STYPI|nr:hypothetical protein AWC38_SpisGene24314 [Stylophora pistillata]
MVVQRHFYALDMGPALTRVSSSCHTCASLQKFPSTLFSQTSEDPPDVIGIAFAADVIKRERQLILVLRECATSYTAACLIADEKYDTMRNALRAVQKLEDELLRQEPGGGPIDQVSLAIAVARRNARLRRQGLSSRELWTQRSQFTGSQLPVAAYKAILSKYQQLLNNHSSSEHAKSPGRRPLTTQTPDQSRRSGLSSVTPEQAPRPKPLPRYRDKRPMMFCQEVPRLSVESFFLQGQVVRSYVVPIQVTSLSSCANRADDEVHDEQASAPDLPQPPLDITHPFGRMKYMKFIYFELRY